MAKKNTQLDEDIIDLTDLIETGQKSQGKAAAAYASAASAPPEDEEDDFEAILAQTTGGQDSQPKVDPHETLDMSDMGGIDNLLESLDIPPQPRENAKQKSEAPAPDEDELDNVLDDLLGNDKPAKSAPSPQPAHPDELDDILASFDSPTPSGKKTEAVPEPPASMPELDADLDDILAEMDPPVSPPSTPEPEPEEKTGAGPDLDLPDDLADMGPTLEEDIEDFLAEKPAAPASSPGGELTGPEVGELFVENSSAEENDRKGEAIPGVAEAEAPMPTPLPSRLPDETLPAQPWPPDALATLCRNLANTQGSQEALQEFSRELGAQSAHVEDMGTQMAHLSKRILACESKLSAAKARIAALEKELEHVSALDDLLREGTPLNAGFMSLISSAISNALKGTNLSGPANPESPLHADLEKLDAGLWSADQRIEALEKAIANTHSPEAEQIEKLDAGLWSADQRIEALEKAVAELQSRDPAPQVEKLDTDFRGANARILALETQIQQLQTEGNQMMEKAAAATVAKVLHEEITRLAQS